ncbi:MAG: hypothetical protein ACLGHN_04870 [Bacteriovoracia bacterium]
MKKMLFFSVLFSILTVQYGCESQRNEPIQEQREPGPGEGAPHAVPEHGSGF